MTLAEVTSELFRVLGHPVRVRVLELLVDGPRSGRELEAQVGVDSSRLSQQLAVLRSSGLVSTRRRGRFTDHALAGPGVAGLIRTARCVLTHRAAGREGLLAELQLERAS